MAELLVYETFIHNEKDVSYYTLYLYILNIFYLTRIANSSAQHIEI